MAAGDVESINSAGSPWVVPLLKSNLAKYTASLERDTRHRHHSAGQHRRTNPDDCCNYCEVYRDGALPQSKQHEIDVWRREVNLTLLQQHARARSASLSTARQASSSLRYVKQNYTAPGTPDTEPGFRRVKDLNSVTSRDGGSKQRSLSAHGRRALSRSVDFGSLALGTPRSGVTVTSQSHTTGTTDRQLIGYKPPVSSLNTSRTPSSASSPEGDMSRPSQSTSNQLLNVTTIDDYIYRSNRDQRFSAKLRPNTATGSAKGSHRTNGHVSSRSEITASTRTITSPADQDSRLPRSATKSASTSRTNKSLTTEKTDSVPVHQRLYNGTAPKHILHDPESTKPPPESKTFRRLHRNLHRWIDDELLRPRITKGRLEAMKQPHSAEQPNGHQAGLQHKDNPVHRSAPSLANDNHLKDPEYRESFLGMLIEMDKSTVTTQRTDASPTQVDATGGT